MSNVKCETVREWIPDYVSGRLDHTSVQSHVKACDDCRAEVELARLIFESRVLVAVISPDTQSAPMPPCCPHQNRRAGAR